MSLPTEPLCLLTVHAHPDDEASKGASTVARYHDEGVRTVLVCCTGGEEGDILNPAMERPEIRERLSDVRREELAESAKIIGYDEVVMLGYHDSGMPDTEANARPEAFANAPEDEAVGRLVAIIRRAKPQVIVTYGDDQTGYPHPDHLRVHDISVVAFDRAGDPAWHPEHGEPFQPAKLYYSTMSMRRFIKIHEKMLELGIESPFSDEWFTDREGRSSQEERITTRVDISNWSSVRRLSLLAHATQVDPTSKFWFGLPDDASDGLHTHDDYIRAQSRVEAPVPEDDLFAGIR
jgi:mycothiol S-conjugate amidase